MKLSPAVKGLIFSVLAVLFAFGIYFVFLAKKNYYLVDNPTPETYYFKINNGSEKILSSGQFLKVELPKGRNTVSVFDKDKTKLYDSAFTVQKNRGLLNITKKDYYIHTQYYGYNIKRDSLLQVLDKTYIDGKEYVGAPVHFNRLYTEDFYFNIDEDYDAVVKNIQKVESRSKIFRKQDFLNYYRNYYKF